MAKSYTNNSDGPKAIHTTDKGVVILAKGETADLNVSDANDAAMTAAGLLDASETGGPPSLAELQKEIASGATPAALMTEAPAAESKGKSAKAEGDKPGKGE